MISDSDIRDVIGYFVTAANAGGALEEIFEHYKGKKSLSVQIVDANFKTGFIFSNGSLRMMSLSDNPTVTVTMDKNTFWRIMNSEGAGQAKALIMNGIYAEETIHVNPPPGLEGGALHLQNVIYIFEYIAHLAYGD